MLALLIAATLFAYERDGISFKLDSESTAVDPARSVFVRAELKTAADRTASMPDFRDRVTGFSLAEDFAEEPKTLPDGSVVQVSNWRLVPEPCAKAYKIRPFVVKASPKLMSYRTDEGKFSFVGGPIRFEPPAARETVTGGMEIDPKKDLPPLSWRLVGFVSLGLVVLAALVVGVVWAVRYLLRRIREHRMSPIERAWVELERLLQKGLPGRGRYKDFYVELTMVVRRYVQRKYGIKAPHLTTEEFFAEVAKGGASAIGSIEKLRRFLESADMVKFAGVEATPDMADEATESARGYLKGDDAEVRK